MKQIFSLFFLAFIVSTPAQAKEWEDLTSDLNKTGAALFYLLAKSENSVISPFSISTSLLMAYMGARGNTAAELKQVLNLRMSQKKTLSAYVALDRFLRPNRKGDSSMLLIGNGMWVDNQTPFLQSYKDLIETQFDATLSQANFKKSEQTTIAINQWVAKKTDNNMQQFLTPTDLSPSTKMLLINALFFKGEWHHPFESQKTGESNFFTSKNGQVKMRMMHQTASFPYYENKDTQLIALPIKTQEGDAQFSLLIFLPKHPTPSLFDFYYQQGEEGLLNPISRLEPKNVALTLPKFKINQKLALRSLLQTMGIKDAFSVTANFSGIDGKKDLYLSKALHQCMLSVDEGGIFASASSSLSFNLKSQLPMGTPITFNANHPFLFILLEMKTKLILFIGEYTKPPPSLSPTASMEIK